MRVAQVRFFRSPILSLSLSLPSPPLRIACSLVPPPYASHQRELRSGWEGQSKGAIAKAAAAATIKDAGDAEEQSKKVEDAARRQSAAEATLAVDIEQARRMNEIEEAAEDDAKEREERVEA